MGDSETRNCLICEVPTNEVHLGIDSCRACCIFYKRTVKLNKDLLKCTTGKEDCIEIEPSTTCRKCRFRKFSDILEHSAMDFQDEIDLASSVENVTQPSTSFIDHESFSLLPSPPSDTPLLDRIKNGYGLMCLIRKAGEVPYIPDADPSLEPSAKEEMDFYPFTYSLVLPIAKIYITAFIDFGNAIFSEFRSFSDDEKREVVLASYNIVVLMDTAYRSVHYFPDCDTAISGYMFTVNDEGTEAFLDSCPNDINKEEIAKLFREQSIKLIKMKEHFKLLAPTENEFALLLGLSFWNNAVSIASEPMTPIVEKYRNAVMNELHTTYKQQGRRDYAARLGELMCLLSRIEELCTLSKTDLEQYKLMNIFDF